MPTGRARDPHKEQFWRNHLQRWPGSGLSIRAYCRRHRLAEASFHAWRRTLGRREGRPLSTSAPPAVTFLPLLVRQEATAVPALLEVVLRQGRCLRVPVGFDAATLRALLVVLEGLPC